MPCREFGYVPFGAFDPASTGRATREGSRTLEVSANVSIPGSNPERTSIIQYAFNDFGVRQTALLLGKTDDVATYTNRSLVLRLLI